MDDLGSLRGRINSYADYADEDSRRLSDQQVRAYVGERLAALRDRLVPDHGPSDALDRALFRCEFSDQRVMRGVDHGAGLDADALAHLHALERRLLDAADRAAGIAAAGLDAYVAEIDALFDQRAGALTAAPSH